MLGLRIRIGDRPGSSNEANDEASRAEEVDDGSAKSVEDVGNTGREKSLGIVASNVDTSSLACRCSPGLSVSGSIRTYF